MQGGLVLGFQNVDDGHGVSFGVINKFYQKTNLTYFIKAGCDVIMHMGTLKMTLDQFDKFNPLLNPFDHLEIGDSRTYKCV